eukprot:6487343-Amphidinium_carterae.1
MVLQTVTHTTTMWQRSQVTAYSIPVLNPLRCLRWLLLQPLLADDLFAFAGPSGRDVAPPQRAASASPGTARWLFGPPVAFSPQSVAGLLLPLRAPCDAPRPVPRASVRAGPRVPSGLLPLFADPPVTSSAYPAASCPSLPSPPCGPAARRAAAASTP